MERFSNFRIADRPGIYSQMENDDTISATPLLSEFTLVSLDGLVSVLKQAIPIGSIYNCGQEHLDLIIILQKDFKERFDKFENLLNLAFLGYPSGHFSIHTFGTMQQLVKEGNLFYTNACQDQNLIYLNSPYERLNFRSQEHYSVIQAKLESIFKKEMGRVVSFFSGAKECYDTQSYDIAVFMLQQACELTYRCLLNLFRGKDIKSHELHVLRKNVARYAPEIVGVFSKDDQSELAYLAILDTGYIDARYNRDYQIEPDQVKFFLKSIDALIQRTFSLFDDRLEQLNSVKNQMR